jgi:glycosyltransferase involved in cell wall biosynthesis
MTDPLGQSQVLPYLIGLSKDGNEFTLISFEKRERYFSQKEIIENICSENNIKWVPLFYTKRPPVLSTLFDVYKMWRTAKKLHQYKNFELIHCRSYISALIGLGFKRRYKIQFLFDMRGFWADERVDGGLWNLKNPVFRKIYTYFKYKEIQFLQESCAVVSLTYTGENEMRKWEKEKKLLFSPISVIPCCTDLKAFPLVDRQQQTNDLGYIGSLGTWYLLNDMLSFFKVYQGSFPKARFHFLTKDNPSLILENAKLLGINETSILIEEAARKEIPEKIKNWKASVFFIKPSYSKMSSSPVKQGELMAMGIPVFCNSGVGDTDRIINTYHSGILIDELNDIAYEKSLVQLENTNFEASKIREGAKTYFSLENGINAYLKIYDSLSK